MRAAFLLGPVVMAVGLLSACGKAPQKSAAPSPTPRPTVSAASPTPQDLPYRPPAGPPSLAPQATPGSQAPGLNDQEKVERLFQEAN